MKTNQEIKNYLLKHKLNKIAYKLKVVNITVVSVQEQPSDNLKVNFKTKFNYINPLTYLFLIYTIIKTMAVIFTEVCATTIEYFNEYIDGIKSYTKGDDDYIIVKRKELE